MDSKIPRSMSAQIRAASSGVSRVRRPISLRCRGGRRGERVDDFPEPLAELELQVRHLAAVHDQVGDDAGDVEDRLREHLGRQVFVGRHGFLPHPVEYRAVMMAYVFATVAELVRKSRTNGVGKGPSGPTKKGRVLFPNENTVK